jgi:hypothetical protein
MESERSAIQEVSALTYQDFEKFGITTLMSNADFNGIEEFKLYLTDKISGMMENKFEKLINTLYLIDISEDKLNQVFKSGNKEVISSRLAELIIERQLLKHSLRERYRRGEL